MALFTIPILTRNEIKIKWHHTEKEKMENIKNLRREAS